MTRAARGSTTGHARKVVHVAMGGFAVLLRVLSWHQAALLAGAALAFNHFVLPRLGGRRLHRPADHTRGYAIGILLYPLAVLLLILIFPGRLDLVAAAWGILAAGDGMAGIVGEAVGGRRLPWNPRKTIAGSLAFVVFGGMAGAALAWWCRPAAVPPPYPWFSLAGPLVAAIAAAGVESLPIGLDDNLSVPAAAAAVLWAGSYLSADLTVTALSRAAGLMPAALLLNAGAATAAWRAGAISLPGAVVGGLIGVVIYGSAGWPGWVLLMATFGVATVASRIGLRRKIRLGIAEEHGGRRGPGNAIANTGVAAVAAVLAATSYFADTALVACAAALAAGGSDTVASEIGKAFGRTTVLVPSLRRVPAGTPGAVSLEGSAAGLAGALALAWLAFTVGLIDGPAVVATVIGATAGSWAESIMGATLEPAGIVDNNALNFLNTFIAAVVAVQALRLR